MLVFHSGPTKSGRTHRSTSTSREISDAVEVLLCGTICAEDVPRGMSIGSGERLRHALQYAPRDRAVTVILDFEPDKATAGWVRRTRSIRTVTVDRGRWLELLAPAASAIDARQLPELIELQRAVRRWYQGSRGEFQWTRWDRTSDSVAKVAAAAAEARRETDAAIVVAGLCEAIAEGALHAGRVINARNMSSRTGLSAGTLADALRHLVEDGLVDQDRAGNFYVPTPAERDVLESYTARGLLGTASCVVWRHAAAEFQTPSTPCTNASDAALWRTSHWSPGRWIWTSRTNWRARGHAANRSDVHSSHPADPPVRGRTGGHVSASRGGDHHR